MFQNLIESKPKKDRSVGGAIFSVLMHVGLGALLVVATLNAGQKIKEKNRQEEVKFVEVKPKEPPPPEPVKQPPPQQVAAPPPPKGFQVLTAPINIPDKIPDVDLSKAVTNEADFTGKGQAGGRANGVVGAPASDQPFFEFQVEKPAEPKGSNPTPKYPSLLEEQGVAGEVMIQFVVDTSGKVELNSVKVLKSTNDLFSNSVKNVLPELRFLPAEAGGHKVRQLVQQPFAFASKK